MKIKQIIKSAQKINGLALLQDDSLVYCSNHELHYRSHESGATSVLVALPDYIDTEAVLAVKVSEDKRYVVVYTVNQCDGFVFDRQKAVIVMHLQRGDYHVRHCAFPIALFEQNGNQYLVHATDWNVVHITNLETMERITERKQVAYEDKTPENKDRYLDYFHFVVAYFSGQAMDRQQWLGMGTRNTDPYLEPAKLVAHQPL